ncbi:MAG: hypothetical protein ACREAM_24465, partial [Blastocatellia bacterium]
MRSSYPAYVNLAQWRGDIAQIGAALITKPAYFARDWGFALRAYVNHSEYVKFNFIPVNRAQKSIYDFKPGRDAKSVCGLNQLENVEWGVGTRRQGDRETRGQGNR